MTLSLKTTPIRSRFNKRNVNAFKAAAAAATVDTLGATATAVNALWAVVEAPGTTIYRDSRDGMRGVFMFVDALEPVVSARRVS